MALAFDIIRMIGDEFCDVSDEKVEFFISLALKRVCPAFWGSCFNQALAYLAMHMMKVQGQAAGDCTQTGAAGPLLLERAGEVTRQYAPTVGKTARGDAGFVTTIYGRTYLDLLHAMPGGKMRSTACV